MYVLNEYTSGNITFSEYQERSNALIDELYTSNTIGDTVSSSAQKVGSMFEGISNKIGAVAETYGEAAYQYIADWITDFLDDYEVLSEETVINTDMNGYGAKMVIYDYYDGSSVVVGNPSYTSTKLTMYYVYGDYITYDPDYEHYNGYLGKYQVPSNQVTYWRPWYNSEFTTHGNSGSHCVGEHTKILVYGDVRYLDGTEAPSLEPSTTTTTSDLNFDNATDQELLDLVNDIYEELERQTPDLSNIEGLLTSIYYRLGALDSDNDNSLLAEINAAIIALAQSNRADTNELITKLDELKDSLKSDETTETDLTDITNELKDISATLKGLALIEVAENLLETTEQEQKLFNEYANLIPLLVDKVGLAIVQQTMTDIESMIFTSSTPNDLKATVYGTEYTILSKDMFTEDVIKYINIAKTFISILLIYLWCSKMRKKLAGGGS